MNTRFRIRAVLAATAGALAVGWAGAASGMVGHARGARVTWRAVGLVGLPSMAGAVLGAKLHELVPDRVTMALFAAVLLVAPQALLNIERMMKDYPAATRMLSALTPDQRGVLDWLSANTAPDDAILVEPRGQGSIFEGDPFPGGLERLSGRGFIVNYKFIPTMKRDLVRWYGLIRARERFFRGDCTANATLGADYAIFLLKDGRGQATACVTPLYSNPGYMIGRVLPLAAGS
jgi:hypothetical protein